MSNFTKIENGLLKEVGASDLSSSEFKVFLCVLRKTAGFHKQNDAISITQMAGFGGISRRSVLDAIEGLVKISLLVRKKQKGKTNEYGINYDFGRSDRGKYESDKYGTSEDSLTGEDSFTSEDSHTSTSEDSLTGTSEDSHTHKRKKERKKEEELSRASPEPKSNTDEEFFTPNQRALIDLIDQGIL